MKKLLQLKVKRIIKKRRGLWSLSIIALMIMVASWGYERYYQTRIFPGVLVAGYDLSNQTFKEAQQNLQTLEDDFLGTNSITVKARLLDGTQLKKETMSTVGLNELGVKFLLPKLLVNVKRLGREGSGAERYGERLRIWYEGVNLNHEYVMNTAKLEAYVDKLASDVDVPGLKPEIKIVKPKNNKDQQVEVFGGQKGFVLDRQDLERLIKQTVGQLKNEAIEVTMLPDETEISQEEIDTTKARAEKLLSKKLELVIKNNDKNEYQEELVGEKLVSFIDFKGGFQKALVAEYINEVAKRADREPVNALFKFEGGRVSEFTPSLKGLKLVEEDSTKEMMTALTMAEIQSDPVPVELVAEIIEPKLKTPEVNNLGINELIGKGQSTFKHSIPGRVHNVALTASKINGVLVPPGETFSFNETVGDISSLTGYQQAYVIKEGRSVLGDGGGVCQDSTTLFRAVLDAGLPIMERRAHAYRVGYYEQNSKPGFDATVFAPSPDFKFTNDTPAYILIQAKADTKALTLEVDLYGTSDGRKAEISNYTSWDASPAPPTLYQDDPTIPKGTLKQVDFSAPGLKVKFDYTVTRNGEVIFQKTFQSVYQPWRAIYLRGV
jgi:vancomycin resistance protein YoaR